MILSTYDTDGVRITGFTGSTPSFSSSTDFYTNNAWSGAETVAGSDEAIVRFNTLKHYSTNMSTGYLPVGPDLNKIDAVFLISSSPRTQIKTGSYILFVL